MIKKFVDDDESDKDGVLLVVNEKDLDRLVAIIIVVNEEEMNQLVLLDWNTPRNLNKGESLCGVLLSGRSTKVKMGGRSSGHNLNARK